MKTRGLKKTLALLSVFAMCIANVVIPLNVSAESALPTLTIDMTPSAERPLKHGATGFLYGLSADQVPSKNTLVPIKPKIAVTKAPNGMQHPDGDATDVAKGFVDSGGWGVQIYMADYYSLWPYEFSGGVEYLESAKVQAQDCIDAGVAEDVIYIPFNEPNSSYVDGWYDDQDNWVTGWTGIYWLWYDIYNAIHEIYDANGIEAEPRFAGLNWASYNTSNARGFFTFCAQHDCYPDQVTWHDLSTSQFNNFGNEYNSYRAIEAELGVEPREIVINEYAVQTDCANPGKLARWLGLFEDYNVSACLPFWNGSNHLNGLAADNNEGNGAWWLYKWYGDMSGKYLPTTVSNQTKDTFYGVSSLDDNKKVANVVFSGINGSSQIVLDDVINTETFAGAEKVHVKLEETVYTGHWGVAEEPAVIKEGAVAVVDGKASIPVANMDAMNAYRITVTPAADDEPVMLLTSTWRAKYEAEAGVLANGAYLNSSYNETWFAISKTTVFGMNRGHASVTIDVNVPKDGYYKLDTRSTQPAASWNRPCRPFSRGQTGGCCSL